VLFERNALRPGTVHIRHVSTGTGGISSIGVILAEAQTGQGEADVSIKNPPHGPDFLDSIPCQKVYSITTAPVRDRPNRVYAGLATLARKLAADFMAIDRVHDDDIIGAVVAEECRFYDFSAQSPVETCRRGKG